MSVEHDILTVPLTEFLVTDSDFVSNETAYELGKELGRIVINIPGGIKNIQSIDRASLKLVLEATETKTDETL